MTILVYLVLLGWIPIVFGIFNLRPHRQAAAVAVVGAWLILPPYSIVIAELPDYSKNTAAAFSVLLSTLIFCPDRLLNFRPRWFDLPMLLFCFCSDRLVTPKRAGAVRWPVRSLNNLLLWGLPYLFGRIYFGSLQGMQLFATTMMIGGVSLCTVLPLRDADES